MVQFIILLKTIAFLFTVCLELIVSLLNVPDTYTQKTIGNLRTNCMKRNLRNQQSQLRFRGVIAEKHLLFFTPVPFSNTISPWQATIPYLQSGGHTMVGLKLWPGQKKSDCSLLLSFCFFLPSTLFCHRHTTKLLMNDLLNTQH